jgi:hypothetical protein
MSDFETLLRNALDDPRRSIGPKPDPMGWVASRVHQQRVRLAAISAVAGLTALSLVMVIVGVVIPAIDSARVDYVAGQPEDGSGFLSWQPAGTWNDAASIDAALRSWSDSAGAGAPLDGSAYLVAAAVDTNGRQFALLQAKDENGRLWVGALNRSGAGEEWTLWATGVIAEPNEVKALALPAGLPLGQNDGSPQTAKGHAGVVLAPEWRPPPSRAWEFGWAEVSGIDADPEDAQTEPLVTRFGNWWAPVPTSGNRATLVVLERGTEGPAPNAPILSVPSVGTDVEGLTALDISLVGGESGHGSQGSLRDLGAIEQGIHLSGFDGPVAATVIGAQQGSLSAGRPRPEVSETRQTFMQLEEVGSGRISLVALGMTDGTITCSSIRRYQTAQFGVEPLVGLACPCPVEGGQAAGLQGTSWTAVLRPGLPPKEVTLRTVFANGHTSRDSNLTYRGKVSAFVLKEDAGQVSHYVFTVPGEPDWRWVWPASD